MRRILLFVMAIGMGLGVKAQCPLNTAVDFTATDCHGTEVHLFDILDSGQYVLIDFFFTSCYPCQQATPKIRDSYTALGCNMHDVYYMEISDRDSDAACQTWVNNYGIEYPTISGAAGGSTICGSTMYRISGFPTIILIAPDRSIVIKDLWPIDDVQTIITALENYDIQQHDCDDPSTGLAISESINMTLFPNPASESVILKGENLGMVSVYNVLGQKMEEFVTEGSELILNTSGYENGVYMVKAGEKTMRFVVKH